MVLLAKQGHDRTDIAQQLHCGKRTVQEWVHRYNVAGGVAGLHDRAGRGDKPTLTREQQRQLMDRLDAGPTVADGPISSFHGPHVQQRILAKEMNVLMPLRTVQHTLFRLGYRYLKPRPRHHKADAALQDDFKKSGCRSGWRRPEPLIRASG
jgi:transposase